MQFLCCRTLCGSAKSSDVKSGSIGTQVESRVRTSCGHGPSFRRWISRPITARPASPPFLALKDSPVRPLSTFRHHPDHHPVNPTTDSSPSTTSVSHRIASSTDRRYDFRPPSHHQDMSSRGGKSNADVNRYVASARGYREFIVNSHDAFNHPCHIITTIAHTFSMDSEANHSIELCSSRT